MSTEPCLRCGVAMEWRHGTWQCPRCRFKVGCCEGETGECAVPAPPPYASTGSPAGVAAASSGS